MAGTAGRYPGPEDPTLRARWRRDRRRAARDHHPDRGGAPDALRRELAAVDRRYQQSPEAGRTQPVPRRPTVPRTVRGTVRALRARIPQGWPGHRRYLEL